MNAMHERESGYGGQVVAGLVLIAGGLGFLLYNLGMVEISVPWRWWPLILVAIGAGRLATAHDGDRRRSGAWLVVIGCWLLINSLGLFGLGWHDSWPLLIVAAGGMILWKSLSPPERPAARGREAGEAEAGEAGGEAR